MGNHDGVQKGEVVLSNANENQIEDFKIKYCRNECNRKKMAADFDVEVEAFEELLPRKSIRSYATGNRCIENSFIMFCVSDKTNGLKYYPVFSESVGRKMLVSWNKSIPKKRSIFLEENKGTLEKEKTKRREKSKIVELNIANGELRNLILFTHSLMFLHMDSPKPMNGMFKNLYEKLEKDPSSQVKAFEIKSVNTALKNFFEKKTNVNKEAFHNLQDYIKYLKTDSGGKSLISTSFDDLRIMMQSKYPMEHIYF